MAASARLLPRWRSYGDSDVAGEGSGAAGVSVALRHTVRGLTREVDEPEDVLARVNELLLAGHSLNDFATAILIRLDHDGDRWRLALAAAGHPPAIHLRGEDHAELGGGSVLGGWPDPRIARHDSLLAAGETLVLCTDGWLEAGPVEGHADPDHLARAASALPTATSTS